MTDKLLFTLQQKSQSILQAAANKTGAKAKAIADNRATNPLQKKENKTGLPDKLKSGIENLSGLSMDSVKVHYHSDKPMQLNAHAYAHGTDIHIAPGQEKHLAHEAWHVVQQKQGRVKPTMQLKGRVDINDDQSLEKEADEMGARSLQHIDQPAPAHKAVYSKALIQRRGFADPAHPNSTSQWEGRGYLTREQGEQRPANLAALVDQFKKEMLTYIAHYIIQINHRNYGPHVAVIITGSAWNIAVNSNIDPAITAHLQADANLAKAHIDSCWHALDNTYGNLFTTKTWFDNDEVEAAYLAFRWAAGKANVHVVANAGPAPGPAVRTVHGEMRIIDHLQAAAPAAAAALPGALLPPGAVAVLPAGHLRVVRTGGTKTPCADCAWEMNKVGLDQAQMNVNTAGAHGPAPAASLIGAGPNAKVATTMSPTFGPAFPTWQSADFARGRRNTPLILGANRPGGAVPNFFGLQQQNYTALRAAYVLSGCHPAMV